MIKKLSRPLSVLLSLMMVIGIFTAVPFVVQAETDSYVKVTSAPTDWSGDYLIVYEDNSVAFNGGAATLDATSNTISVSISDNSIASNETTDAAKFTIAKIDSTDNYSIKSASGYYIGRTAYSNGLNSSTSDEYQNTISIDNNGIIAISSSSGAILRFNKSSDQLRFRYFKSGQQAIQLYKLTGSGGDTPEPTTEPTTAEPTTEPTTEEPTPEPTEATEATTEPAEQTGVTDTLTPSLINSSSYNNWSGKTVTDGSGAVYAGNSMGGTSYIQIRSKDSTSGIVTTTSGGKAKKVVVTWNSGTDTGRTLDIYGKNTAYSTAADLYKSSSQGTKLGSIVYGTSTELTIDGDNEYIGMRSNNGAMYFDKIKITWNNETEPTEPATETPTEEPTEPATEEPTEPSDEKKDVLNSDLTGITVNQYSDWSGSCENGSDAVYSGHSAGNYSSIQLRTSDNQSGIVTTTSGGKVAKVRVTWNNNTGNGQTLQIYGKNTAYTGPADLYSSDTRGKLLGTITKGSNQSTEFTVDSGTYAYIGLRSASGAMYLTDITITWVPLNAYNVTFKDGETVLDSHDVNIDDHPVYSGETDPAAKPADAHYTYTFLGWTDGTTNYGVSDQLPAVTDDNVVYSARYDKTVNKYTVTWQSDGVTLYQDDVDYGEMPVYRADTPTKTDDDYDYTFDGWKSSLDGEVYYSYNYPTVTQAVTYTAQFTATPKPYCTVIWKNWDGSTLKTDTKVIQNTTPVYGGVPQRTADSNYTYDFIGWATGENNSTRYYDGMELPAVTSNTEFTALYEATPRYKSGRIVSTQDSSITYNVGGKYYLQDNELKIFTSDASFADNYVNDGTFTLGNAVFTVTEPYPASGATGKKPTVSEFTHTVYVTGEGTQDDPFVFYPNFRYSAPDAANVNESNALDKTEMHPGDILKGMARLRVGYDYVRFLQYIDQPDYDCQHGTKGFMGVSKDKYGYRYETSEAIPYSFVYGYKQLYYLGELGGAHNYSEKITYDTELGDVTPIYTVTWINYDGTLIDTNQVYQGISPAYTTAEEAISVKPEDDYIYTFSGWKNAETEETYGKDETLPVMTGDVTYIADFDAELIPTYTVIWLDDDGTPLETDENVKVGTTPSYDGDTPVKEKTEQKVYFFSGWDDGENTYSEFDELPGVTKNVTYTATYDECSCAGYEPIENIEWVFRTDDNVAYDLEHMYYTYNGSDPMLFDGWSMFKRNGDTLLLGGKAVADIGVPLTEHNKQKADYWHAEFANSVYVTGDGSYYDPFEFHPNYLFYGTQTTVNQGFHVALKEEYIKSVNINNLSYPGDQFKGCALIAVGGSGLGIQDVHYITKNVTEAGETPSASSWYVGVSLDGYGKDYQKAEIDNKFENGHEILYYYGEEDDVFLFDEYAPTYQNSFGTPTTYTVNWLNDDGSVLESEEYYYGETPEYNGETPVRSEQAYKYTFSGWSEPIEVVTGDVDYTAQYTKKKLFAGHSLTLGGDIGVCFFLDVPIADLTVDDVKKGKANGGHDVSVKFSWYNKKSEYKIRTGELDFDSEKNMFVAKCYVAAAEMAYNIHATAYIDGVEYTDEYNDYSVRQYGLKIINSEDGTFGDKHNELVDLAKKMLDYGAKSQVRFNRTSNTDGTPIPFANEGVDYTMQEHTIDRAKPDLDTQLSEAGLKFYGTSVVFLTKTTLRQCYIVTDVEKFDNLPNRNDFVKNGSYYYLQVENINAYSLDDAQTFTINGVEYYYSVLDFAVQLQNGTKAEKDLGTALYWYNEAAKSFFE